jgi:hypothetical protein
MREARPSRGARPRRAAALVALAWAVAPAAAFAQTTPASPAADASGAFVGGAPSPDAGAAESDARAESQAAAALRATQDLEVQLLELRRDVDAFARERAAYDDLRRRLDTLDARRGAGPRGRFDDWASLPAIPDGLRFSHNGYVIRSPDNRFMMRPGLRLQAAYEGVTARGALAGQPPPDLSTFRLAHAELLFEGHAAAPQLEYRFEVDFADAADTGLVKDAFVQWRFAPTVAVRAGRMKVPFGLQAPTWNGVLEFVDVAQPTATFSLDRDVGLAVVGRPLAGRLQYQLAIFDGRRTPCPVKPTATLACDAIDPAFAARVVAAPFGPLPDFEGDGEGHARPLVSIGVSGAYGLVPTDVRARTGNDGASLDLDGDNRVDNVSVWQAAAELRAIFRGAALQAEWFGRREHPGAGVLDRSFWGAYAQGSYFVIARRLQLAARVSRGDQPHYGVAAMERLQRGTLTTEESGALSFYARGHDAKLQLDYTHRAIPDAFAATSEDRVRVAAQLAF